MSHIFYENRLLTLKHPLWCSVVWNVLLVSLDHLCQISCGAFQFLLCTSSTTEHGTSEKKSSTVDYSFSNIKVTGLIISLACSLRTMRYISWHLWVHLSRCKGHVQLWVPLDSKGSIFCNMWFFILPAPAFAFCDSAGVAGELTSEDWGKKVTEYLSLAYVPGHQISCFLSKRAYICLSFPFITSLNMEAFPFVLVLGQV